MGFSTTHEMLFGTSLEDAIQHMVGQAIRTNTKEGYEKAVERLSGVRTFLIFLKGEDAPIDTFTVALLMLSNEIQRMYRLVDDDKARELVGRIVLSRLGEGNEAERP